jgi:Domain of unknown function (DUF4286)
MKILYNVTIIIDHAVHDEWLAWMKSEHIPAVLATGQFTGHTMSRILEDEHNADGVTYAIQYIAHNMDAYQYYQATFAPALQAETQARYGGKFGAFRTCMEIVDHSNAS